MPSPPANSPHRPSFSSSSTHRTTSTTTTTPPRSASPIWDSDNGGTHLPSHSSRLHEASELPAVRRAHMTTGYRAGISAGKDEPATAQRGFDEGYPVGGSLGMRVGWVVGMVRGLGSLEEGEAVERELEVAGLVGDMSGRGWLGRVGGVVEDEGVRQEEEVDGEEAWSMPREWIEKMEVLRKWEARADVLGSQHGLPVRAPG